MRAPSRARWATCALAILISAPVALADRAERRSISECTSFDQTDKDDTTVSLAVANSCTIPVDCKLSWRVVCAPDSKKRRATHKGAAVFTLTAAGARATEASAAMCGDDAWVLDSVNWSCEPNAD